MTNKKATNQELQKRVLELEAELAKNQWLHEQDSVIEHSRYRPFYGDITKLNTERTILDNVGKEMLENLTSELMELLDTSVAIYEKNGDCAFCKFNSGWCQLLDSSSRKLCDISDNKLALSCDKWLCHNDCWNNLAKTVIESKKSIDIECVGGINLYGEPIFVDNQIVGSINVGYGNPPTDNAKLKELSEKFNVKFDTIKQKAESYKVRPDFIIEISKKRLTSIAKLIGEIIAHKQIGQKLKESEEKYKSLINDIVDKQNVGIFILDSNLKIVWINKAIEEYFGIRKNEVIGKDKKQTIINNIQHIFEDPELFKKKVFATYDNNVYVEKFICTVKQSNNLQYRVLEHYSRPITSGIYCGGRVEYYYDLTKLKQSEYEFKESQAKYKRLIDNSNSFIMEVDMDTFKIINCNPSMANNFNKNTSEIIGEDFRKLIPENLFSKRIKYAEKALKENKAQRFEDECNGRYLLNNLIPYKTNNHRYLQIVTYDITEQKKAELLMIEESKKAELINQRYHMAIQATSDGIWDWNLLTNEVYFSPRWKSILGYNDDELPNELYVWENLTKDNDAKQILEILNELVEGKRNKFENEFQMKHKDGHWVDVLSRADVFYNDENKAYRIVGMHTDISERKKSENELKQSEERFRKLFENIPNGVAIYKAVDSGEDFTFIDINKEGEKITNSSKDELIGSTLLQKFPNMINGPLIHNLQKINKDGENIYIPPFYYKDNRREGWRENYIYKLKTGEIVAIFKDVSELKKTEDNLRKINRDLIVVKEKAEQANRLKTQFLNNMSHEIRTPMNGIIGFSERLYSSKLSEEKQKEYIRIIQNSSHQLLKIIDDILDISNLETKQEELDETEFCLNEFLMELFDQFNIESKERNIPFYLKKAVSDSQSYIISDKTKLYKILSNLIENALKFTNTGFVEFGYIIKNSSSTPQLLIYVKDTGVGIKPQNHDRIFELFSQEDENISIKHGGLGLGLAISKENALLLGGDITLESEKGKGSFFCLAIPYKSAGKQKKVSNKQIKSAAMPDIFNILIVEDEEVNYLYLETLFEDEVKINCKIFHAKDGQEAIKMCKLNSQLDLILMDLKMPVMNGFEATKLIRQFMPDITIVAQTAYTTKQDRAKAIVSGCDDFITKPINEDKLTQILNKYLIIK